MSDIEFDPASEVTYDPPKACEVFINGRWQVSRIYAISQAVDGVWEADVEAPEYNGNPPHRVWVRVGRVRPVTEV